MTALDAFLGKGLMHVRVKQLGRITIDFACIRIPHYLVKDTEIEMHDCIIKREGNHTIIMPSFVREYPLLSTADDKLLERLKRWFVEHSKKVIADIVRKKVD